MNKKSKLIILIIILTILVLLCKLIFTISTVKYKITYNNKEFNIEEKYNDNIYIKIKVDNKVYPIRLYEKTKSRKLIKNLYYYSDNDYSCILPIINDTVKVDMMCYKDNIIYDYHLIAGENNELDEYVKNIKLYDINKFKDITNDKTNIGSVTTYSKKYIKNKMAITNYRGLIVDNKNIELFKKDVYDNKLSVFFDYYYLVADYNNDYVFKYFYVVDLLNNNVYKIKSKTEISLDSYIQGVVDNKVYLYDKDNEKQYRIDVVKKKVDLIGSENSIKFYTNNKWQTISSTKANKEIYFNYNTLDNNFTNYDSFIDADNYYYLFKKNSNKYDLYRVDKNELDIVKFITVVPTMQIYYNKDYIYYQDGDSIYYYSDSSGLQKMLENSELKFNNTIKYYIY